MAEIPDIIAPTPDAQVQQPNDTFRQQASPAAFGSAIAQGVEGLGAGVTQGGNVWGQVQTDHVTNGVLQQLSDINERAKTLKGQDALDAQGSIMSSAQDAIAQARDQLKTTSQQLAFDNATKNMWFRYFQPQLNNHFNEQGQAVAVATNKDTINQTLGFIPAVAGNQETVDNLAEDMATASHKLVQSQLGMNAPHEALMAAGASARASAYKMQIETLGADPKTVPAALVALERNKADLGADYPALLRQLQGQQKKADVSALVQGIISGNTAPGAVTGQSGPRAQNIPNATGAPNSASNAVLEMIKEPESGGEYDRLYQPSGQPAKRISDLSQFPQWEGAPGPAGPSHAAGAYQFEPGTWASAAKGADVNDFSPASQDKAAWYLASNTYQQKTGRDLAEDVAAGHTSEIKDALKGQWPSITDKSIAGLNARLSGGGTAAAPPVAVSQATNDAQTMPKGFPRLQEDWIASIPPGLPIDQYEEVRSGLSREYNHMVQATSAERAQTEVGYRGGLAMLADGRDFPIDPNKYYRVFPDDKAQEMIGNLQDAKSFGLESVAVRGMSPDQITAAQAQHQDLLNSSQGDGYVRQRELSVKFDQAVQQHEKQLGEDPAAYIMRTNPQIQQAAAALKAQTPEQQDSLRANGRPDAYESFAAKVIQEQDRLGVPKEAQHVLTQPAAQSLTQQMMKPGGDPLVQVKQWQQLYGNSWPKIFGDMVQIGGLPGQYESIPNLPAQDAADLALGLQQGAPDKDGKPGKAWSEALGEWPTNPWTAGKINDLVSSDPRVTALKTAWSAADTSVDQISQRIAGITTLAMAKRLYHADEDPVTGAINAYAANHDFLPGQPVLVPKSTPQQDYRTTGELGVMADTMLANMKRGYVQVPPDPHDPRLTPTPEDYIAQLQAHPRWINTKDGEGMQLKDWANGTVRDAMGNPVMIRFTDPFPKGAGSTDVPAGLGTTF